MRPAARPFWLLAVLMLAACIDPIGLDVGPPEQRLVVQGLVREGPGPHAVSLRRSAAYTQGVDAIRSAEEGARVTVLVGDGSEVVLPMVLPGVYRSAAGVLVGKVGESYGLRIETADGVTYEAAPQVMRASPEIDSFHFEVERIDQLLNGVLVQRPYVSLFVRPEATPNERVYYRFGWSGVAQVEVCTQERPQPTCQTCYIEVSTRSQVQIATNAGVGNEGLPPQRAALFDPRGRDAARLLAHPLYLSIEQQAITPEAYAQLDFLRETAERVGGLFDPPPDAAVGNVRNVEDERDAALGMFVVAGLSSREACFVYTTLPDRPVLAAPTPLTGACGVNVIGSLTPPPAYAAACSGR